MKRLIAFLLSLSLVIAALPAAAAPAGLFTDVAPDAWYYDAVRYGAETGLFSGTSATEFSPNRPITRAEFVTVLANRSGVDPAQYKGRNRFSDVNASGWYAPYVQWAALYGVAAGTGQREFSPGAAITREQMAVMLYNYAKKTGGDVTFTAQRFNTFPDHGKVSWYAVRAMQWATSQGLINGMNGKLNPKGKATRAQAAAVFKSAAALSIPAEILTKPVYISASVKKSAGLYAGAKASKASATLPAGTRVQVEQTTDPLWYLIVLDDAAQKQWGVKGKLWYMYAENLFRVENGQTASVSLYVEEVNRRFDELREIFPHGKYWNHMGSKISTGTQTPYSVTNTPCNHSANGSAYCNRYKGVTASVFTKITCMQCLGFASLLGDEVFGTDAPIHSYRDLNLLRVGDHIRYSSPLHSVTVTGIYDTYITVAEVNRGNISCKIEWGRKITYTELKKQASVITCYTRYPLKYTGTGYTTW